MTIKRSVLANLESGRRTTISVPELLILADVLGVPPLMLLFPIGWEQATKALPGTITDPWHAAQWFMGYTGDPANPAAERPPEGRALWYWQENDRYAGIIRDAHERLGKAVAAYDAALARFGATTTDAERHRELADSEARHLMTAAAALLNLRQAITRPACCCRRFPRTSRTLSTHGAVAVRKPNPGIARPAGTPLGSSLPSRSRVSAPTRRSLMAHVEDRWYGRSPDGREIP